MNTIKHSFRSKKSLFCSLLIAIPLLNGCVENYFPESEMNEDNEKVNQESTNQQTTQDKKSSDTITASDNDEDNLESEELLSKEQKALIEDLEDKVSPEQAVKNIGKDTGEGSLEVIKQEKVTLTSKDKITELNEFNTFIAELFYQYHSKQINSEKFLNLIEPHLDESFIDQLPKDHKARIEMFDTLQSLFVDGLSSDITNYIVTTSQNLTSENEAKFYRKYTLEDGSQIYYETTARRLKGNWLLVDDVPTTAFEIEEKEIGDEM